MKSFFATGKAPAVKNDILVLYNLQQVWIKARPVVD